MDEIKAIKILPQNTIEGITFVVSNNNEIYYMTCYGSHTYLVNESNLCKNDIMWGGILNKQGKWIRESLDFGSARSIIQRDLIIHFLIRNI